MLICCLIQIHGNNANYRCDVLNNQTYDTAKAAAAVIVSQSVVGNVMCNNKCSMSKSNQTLPLFHGNCHKDFKTKRYF